MGEEMDLSNEAAPRNGVETIVMMVTSETDTPAKTPLLPMHRLRNLAIASIICGCSCIGVLALIYAIKASEKRKAGLHDSAVYWTQKSRCLSLLSICVWVSVLIMVPLSVWLIAYILARAE
ncbi:transmembrane protein 265 [Hemicordylus capensis]|uniref:transmembrane protein 265 n=1 Tax=Hemicordylus capensis TaxID=884348 RepID=UPI0023032A0D|nr:transmembrane protein 265 [Hemicordylus capensis]